MYHYFSPLKKCFSLGCTGCYCDNLVRNRNPFVLLLQPKSGRATAREPEMQTYSLWPKKLVFPKIGGTSLGVPIIRIILYCGLLYWSPSFWATSKSNPRETIATHFAQEWPRNGYERLLQPPRRRGGLLANWM